ncbi:MAG: DUF2779 domain-containing protein [Coriobacteriaceae bacterium]|nr:DUF2779 domain-containing protein [Coriobacteriaceae bacterium]
MNLSKSRYTRGVQCARMLWLNEHHPELFDDSVMNQAVLATGNEVGDLAMGYFGDFVEVPFDRNNMTGMIAKTQEYLEAGERVICEASFSYDGNFCSVDILRVVDNGVEIIEVKSSTSVKDVYYHDVAYQYWVLKHCGLTVTGAYLMYINNQYVRNGDLVLQDLFTIADLTNRVREMQDEVGGNITSFKQIADDPIEPEIAIGPQCFDPYPCGFQCHCWQHIPQPNVFDLGGVGGVNGFRLFNDGYVTFADLFDNPGKLNHKQRIQVQTELMDLPPTIDCGAITEFLATLDFPLYFLDFETFQQAIPPFDGLKPFQQIPSQYSLHVLQSPGSTLEHFEFLAEAGTDPRRPLARRLCADIPENACVLAYNMGFEKGVIKQLALIFPDLAKHLMSIHDNIRDLMKPFFKGHYYSREMRGSYSIKYVLPALFPDDPELNYDNLDGIHNGDEAMNAFANLSNNDEADTARIRAQLLAYCRLDTLAMVRIWEKLNEACA